MPGPAKYIGPKKWVEEKKGSKIDWKSQPTKKSYIGIIFDTAKRELRPGPHSYSLTTDLPSIKEIGKPVKFNKDK